MKNILKITSIVLFSVSAFGVQAQDEIPFDENVIILNEKTINAQDLDFSPAFYEDGIVFIASNSDEAKAKMFDKEISFKAMSIKRARRGPSGALTTPVDFAQELTSPFHEGPLTFDKTAENIFFSRNNYENGALKMVKSPLAKDRRAYQQIYTAQKSGEIWTNITKLPFNQEEYVFRHPTLSLDGKKLYFSSNRPGGQGGFDIWVSQRIGGEWGEPVNLGEKINTPQSEGFPYIHPDGTLYFASDGHKGLGKLDIFYTKIENKKAPQDIKNLGRPFNSAGDDFGLILDLDRKNGYLTSDRTGGLGKDDIYSFTTEDRIPAGEKAPKPKSVICVLDKADKSQIDQAQVKYVSIGQYDITEMVTDDKGSINRLNTSENLNILQVVTEQPLKVLSTDATCKAMFVVDEGEYLVNVTKEGYAPKQVILKTKKDKEEYFVYLEKLDGNKVLTGTIMNDRGAPLLGANVEITDETGEVQTVTTDPSGQFNYIAKPNKKYTVKARKPDHETASMSLDPNTPLRMNIKELVSPYSEGRVFELQNVYYNFNDAALRPEALRDVKALLSIMQYYPEVAIELASHTDCRGSDNYNANLSQRRAESVRRYLVDNGVIANRVVAKGYGETQLRNQCADEVECSEDEHQRNRRTEVRITRAASNAQIRVIDNLPEYTDPKPGSNANNSYASNNGNVVNPDTYTSNDANYSAVGEFWIVAGSYNNMENAVVQMNRMLNAGYTETVVERVDEINTNRVVVKKVNNFGEAVEVTKDLRARGVTSAFVVKR